MSRILQVFIILHFAGAALAGCLGMIYADSWRQFTCGCLIAGVTLYALNVIRRYEKTL